MQYGDFDEDPPEFLLLEILKKVNQPVGDCLDKLGFQEDPKRFIAAVLEGSPERVLVWSSAEQRRRWAGVVADATVTIDDWIHQARETVQRASCRGADDGALVLIRRAAAFAYLDRPTTGELLAAPHFNTEAAVATAAWEPAQSKAEEGSEETSDKLAAGSGRAGRGSVRDIWDGLGVELARLGKRLRRHGERRERCYAPPSREPPSEHLAGGLPPPPAMVRAFSGESDVSVSGDVYRVSEEVRQQLRLARAPSEEVVA